MAMAIAESTATPLYEFPAAQEETSDCTNELIWWHELGRVTASKITIVQGVQTYGELAGIMATTPAVLGLDAQETGVVEGLLRDRYFAPRAVEEAVDPSF